MWLSCVYLKDVCMNNICTCLDSIYLCIDTNQNNFFSRCVLFNIISLISFLNMYHLWVYNSFAQTPIHIYYIDFELKKLFFIYLYCTNSNTFFYVTCKSSTSTLIQYSTIITLWNSNWLFLYFSFSFYRWNYVILDSLALLVKKAFVNQL